jgi:TPR repeat protein
MADVAHDASGPASPKPGDIAPQQVSRPDSPERGKLRVFISYSRDDLHFADQLDAALNACGFECLIDRHGISGGEDWKRRLGTLISGADTVVFVLSPTSARSEICAWEVEKATRLSKRILPVSCRPLEGASPPPRLRERNYIFFYEDPKVSDSGFGTGLASLIAALNTDFDWLREHTRYLQRATEWDRGGRPANRLLSGNDIAEAKAWVARRPKNAPEPTALHLDFIRASEEEAEARSSAQRKQLEAMATAHAEREAALKKAEEAQRKRATIARIRNIALVAVSILALLAGLLGLYSAQQRNVAEAQRELADEMLASATEIIVETQHQMNDNTKKRVLAVFQRGADHADQTSMRNLGIAYRNGWGVAQDYGKAREWYEKAANKGDTPAMTNLGGLYRDGRGVAQDYGKAREWFEKAANKGDEKAMTNLGRAYAEGQGAAQDYAKAREWYEKAADKGDTPAMNHLGLLYYNGEGAAQDYATAREWYEKAADKGEARAMLNLGGLYYKGQGVAQDYTKAREWYEKAAAKGDEIGMASLGTLYYNGEGVAQDYGKAREWYEKAADKGDTPAMYNLGQLYYKGQGVAQDYAKAREWYEKAADKGQARAMYNLGVLYDEGQGVAQDYAKARELYEKAAAKDNANAMSNLGLLYHNGLGVVQDYAKAREWYEKAADKDDATAMLNLGVLYINGLGVAQDYAKAREWLEKAADMGDARATAYLELPIHEAAGAGRHAEALQLQEALTVKVEEVETKREGKLGKETAQALKGVAWYALFAREFTKALTVADRAHALFPDDLAIETNRAHALMFMEHGKEAKALYVTHKGKPISEQDTQLWESAIAEDFAEFRKAGLMHPMMAEIEKELGVSR